MAELRVPAVEVARRAGLSAGHAIRMTVSGKTVTARITGEIYAPGMAALLTSWQTLGGKAVGLAVNQYVVTLRPGTGQEKYSAALSRALGQASG